MSYSSLHNHTHYSLLDGYATPKEYFERAKEIGLKSFAITEHGNAYSWVYFDKIKSDYPDIKMIYGVELYETFDVNVMDKSDKRFHLIALARNENGRKALNKIITKSNLEYFYNKPRVDINLLRPFSNDLVICSACLASKIARESEYNKCVEFIKEYKAIFPYFYLEMQSHSSEDQSNYNKKILQLAKDTNTNYIITTDSHAATKSDLYYQARHVQIAHDTETLTESYEGCYLQDETEIHKIMDIQIGSEAVNCGLKNTNYISEKLIENVNMPFQSPQLPTFPLPDGFNNNYQYLKYLVEIGWESRKFDNFDDNKKNKYKERLDYELEIIHSMGFDGYFLIVWDFINYAKENNVMIGSGRGSCAGSLVCYLLKITDLDPIKYGLIFERFLNPERISMPDTDTDVSDRPTVINYLINKYGENRVCQIINFSFITPVVAIKDVGKVLGFKYAEMDKLSKKFTYETFQDCLDNNQSLILDNPQYNELFDIASHLSGRIKTVSCHAGGVGIVDTDIDDYMPMKLGSKGEHVIQVDKRIVETIGIIKFDILGVQTLNLVKEIQNDLGISEYDININNPKFENDTKPYELLRKALTNGVFQVESGGMKDLLLRLNATSLEDLSAVLALYRPDSMGALEDFVNRKSNNIPPEYIHLDMKPILKNSQGCLIYQEQLLDIVRKFGGRTYGGADLFRKAIGKKDKNLVIQESNKLYDEIKNNGYDEDIAKQISNDMADKGGYLFNRSHSFSYAVLCFQTAYLKTYYPINFFKALFNLNKDKAGMLNKYILDAKNFDVEVLPPNINNSEINFSINNNKILFGLSAITGIGETFATVILDERNLNGKFKDFEDFKSRINPSKGQIISLIKAGAIPTKDKKQFLIRYLKSLYQPLVFKPVSKAPSYSSLILDYDMDIEKYRIGNKKFDYNKEAILKEYNLIKENQFNESQKIRFQKYIEENKKYLDNEEFWEFEALQIFINNNPFSKAYEYMSKSFDEVEDGEECTIIGIIARIQKKKDKNQKQFAYVNIYSSFGLVEAIVWHSQLKEYENLITKGSQIAMLCKKDNEEKVIAKKIKPYSEWLKQKVGDKNS